MERKEIERKGKKWKRMERKGMMCDVMQHGLCGGLNI